MSAIAIRKNGSRPSRQSPKMAFKNAAAYVTTVAGMSRRLAPLRPTGRIASQRAAIGICGGGMMTPTAAAAVVAFAR